MSNVEIITGDAGYGALARAALDGSRPEWYATFPRGAAEWTTHASAIRDAFAKSLWRDQLEPAFAPSGAAAERLSRADVVVTTGQQAGLFGGPLYTWTKALSALAMADALEAQTGLKVAPVFWAATDDADLEEAAWTAVAVPGGVEEIRIAPTTVEGTPMSLVPLGSCEAQLEALRRGAGSALYDDALRVAATAYAPDATVGSAYVHLLRALLEPLGIAVLDASHPRVRDAAAPTLRAALAKAAAIDAALVARERDLRAEAFAPQVAHVPDLSLVFEIGDKGKQRIPIADAERVAAAGKHALSPNVLLRPIVERAILPTVAYCAGPGELAYFAQVSAAADALGAARPLGITRWSATLVEPHIRRILSRYELDVNDLADPHAAEKQLAKRAYPVAAAKAFAELRETIDRLVPRLGGEDALLPFPVMEGARNALHHRLDRVARRALAAVKRREGDMMRDVATARGALFPLGKRQERALNFLPLLARHGPELLDAMRLEARAYASALVEARANAPVPATART